MKFLMKITVTFLLLLLLHVTFSKDGHRHVERLVDNKWSDNNYDILLLECVCCVEKWSPNVNVMVIHVYSIRNSRSFFFCCCFNYECVVTS